MLSNVLKHRAVEYTIYAILAVAFVVLGIGIFWSLEDPRTLDVKNAHSREAIIDGTLFTGIPVQPKELKPGGVIFMHLDYCKLKDAEGKVTAKLVGQRFTAELTWPNDHTKKGCVNSQVPIPLPVDANDDTYYIEFEALYQVNPLKTRTVILRSDVFKVSH